MKYLTFVYKWKSRDLRKVILAILKSWVASNVQKLNYVQNFSFNENKLEKQESKILLINTDDEKKLMDFLSKVCPQMERIFLD